MRTTKRTTSGKAKLVQLAARRVDEGQLAGLESLPLPAVIRCLLKSGVASKAEVKAALAK